MEAYRYPKALLDWDRGKIYSFVEDARQSQDKQALFDLASKQTCHLIPRVALEQPTGKALTQNQVSTKSFPVPLNV
jgi:hypothetical protein